MYLLLFPVRRVLWVDFFEYPGSIGFIGPFKGGPIKEPVGLKEELGVIEASELSRSLVLPTTHREAKPTGRAGRWLCWGCGV